MQVVAVVCVALAFNWMLPFRVMDSGWWVAVGCIYVVLGSDWPLVAAVCVLLSDWGVVAVCVVVDSCWLAAAVEASDWPVPVWVRGCDWPVLVVALW